MQGTERLKSMCCRPSRTVLVRLHCARRRADPVTPVSRLAPKPVDSLRTEHHCSLSGSVDLARPREICYQRTPPPY